MTWKIKRFGPTVTRAEHRFAWGLTKRGIRSLSQKLLKGRDRWHRVDRYFPPDLVVEIDGSSHVGRQLLKDEVATADLEQAPLPFRVIRFRDPEIWNNLQGCIDAVVAAFTPEQRRTLMQKI